MLLESEKDERGRRLSDAACSECGCWVVHAGGCQFCVSCGLSRCEG